MTTINKTQAIEIMEQLLQEGEDESTMCAKQLDLVLTQHHNVYLKYVTIRDNMRNKR